MSKNAPSYYKPRFDDSKTYSVDMVRYTFKCKVDSTYKDENGDVHHVLGLDDLMTLLRFDLLTLKSGWTVSHYDSFKEYGGYRHLFVIGRECPNEWSETTVSVGVCPSVKNSDRLRGFIEYNPNKVRGDAWVWLKNAIGAHLEYVKLARFDLAVDFEIPRASARLDMNGARTYEMYFEHGSYTEYLGARSTVGRVKLYDKAAELLSKSGIDVGGYLTRLEFTLDTDSKFEELPACYVSPQMMSLLDDGVVPEGTTSYHRAFGNALALVDAPARNRVLKDLDPRTRKKVELSLPQAVLPLSRSVWDDILSELSVPVLY